MNDPAPTQGSRIFVRVIFGTLIVALPLQLAIALFVAQPYPGLFQPSFGRNPTATGIATTLEPTISVVSADGKVLKYLTAEELLPPNTRPARAPIMLSAFHRDLDMSDSEMQKWIVGQLDRLQVSGAAGLIVQWDSVVYDISDGSELERESDSVVTVDLSDWSDE